MTLEEPAARAIAEAALGDSLTSGHLVITEVTEYSIGWAYYYQSSAYVRGGDFQDLLGGNAPILVHRQTGAVLPTGTAHDMDYYVAQNERRAAWEAAASQADLVLTAAVQEIRGRRPAGKSVAERVRDRCPEASDDLVDQAVAAATALEVMARKLARSHRSRSDVIATLNSQYPGVCPGEWELLYNWVR